MKLVHLKNGRLLSSLDYSLRELNISFVTIQDGTAGLLFTKRKSFAHMDIAIILRTTINSSKNPRTFLFRRGIRWRYLD